jgi:hypothetical protein
MRRLTTGMEGNVKAVIDELRSLAPSKYPNEARAYRWASVVLSNLRDQREKT